MGFIVGSGPGPVRDFGTERALAEPLGPNTGNFPSSYPRFTLLTELNLTVPEARPEAHTFDFIGILLFLYIVSFFCGFFDVALDLSAQAQGPFVTLEQNGLWSHERALVEPLGPIYIDFPSLSPRFTLVN